MAIIQGPEACDDPKMSGMILVSYSPLILYVLCRTVLPHFSSLESLKCVCISDYLHTDTAENVTVMLQRITAGFVTCHQDCEPSLVKHVPSLIRLKRQCHQLHGVIVITAELK